MSFRVLYLRIPNQPASLCWLVPPIAQDLEHALIIARDGLPSVIEMYGAKGFMIVDDEGRVVVREWVGEDEAKTRAKAPAVRVAGASAGSRRSARN